MLSVRSASARPVPVETKDDDAASLKVLMRVASIAFRHVFHDRTTRPNRRDEVSTGCHPDFLQLKTDVNSLRSEECFEERNDA